MSCVRTICASILALSSCAASAANLLALTNPALIAEERGIYFSGSAFLGSTFAPIREVHSDLRDDYAPRAGRNLALVAARAESGVDWQGFRVGAVYRHEWFGAVGRETLDVYRADRLSLNQAIGATYPIDYRFAGFAARGLQFGKALRMSIDSNWSLKLGATANLLQGQKLREELWSGNALATAPRSLSYSGDATRTWAVSGFDDIASSFIPAYRQGHPGGRGYSIDLGLRLARHDGTFFEWTAADAASRMHWTDIPQITFSGSTGVYNGIFPSGKKWRINIDERLPVKQAMRLSVPVHPAHLEFSDSVMQGYHFPAIGLRKEYASGLSTRLDYDFRFRSVGVNIAKGAMRFGVRSDTIQLTQARALELDMGFKIDF